MVMSQDSGSCLRKCLLVGEEEGFGPRLGLSETEL